MVRSASVCNVYPFGLDFSDLDGFGNLPWLFRRDIFVLNYATHDVTGLDGHYEIKNIPAGKVRVDAFLPVIGKSEGQEIEIKEGDNTLDFTFHFDAAKDLPKPKAAASAPASVPPTNHFK